MSDAKNILFVGTPATGKTSFLAALRHYVDSDLPDKSWYQYREASNTEYINRIHDRWLSCEQQDRTRQEQGGYNQVEMYLESSTTGDKIILNVPDIDGEAFAQQWSSRFWSEAYQSVVESSSGILFFIHPSRITAPILLANMRGLLNSFLDDDEQHEEEYIPWNHSLAPTQVVLVELLQFHESFFNEQPIPISIIVSAWDLVRSANPDMTPEQWLSINLPFLSQYLQANPEIFDASVFGISAEGGDVGKEAVQAELRLSDEPANRIIVQHGDTQSHDICAPIQWIIDVWKKGQS